jgi:hypothetical protein
MSQATLSRPYDNDQDGESDVLDYVHLPRLLNAQTVHRSARTVRVLDSSALVEAATDLGMGIKTADFVAEPVAVPAWRTPQPRIGVLQKWEGRVLDRSSTSFLAVLTDMTNAGVEEQAEFDLEELSPDDLDLVVPGAVFYWNIGYRDDPSGERTRASIIRFRRLPAWSPQDVARLSDRVGSLKQRMGLSD